MVQGETHGAGSGGGYLPPESVPSDFHCRETL